VSRIQLPLSIVAFDDEEEEGFRSHDRSCFYADLMFLQEASGGSSGASLPGERENGGHHLQGAGTEHQQHATVAMRDAFPRSATLSCVPAGLYCMLHAFNDTTSSSKLTTGLSVGFRALAPVVG
jgi:hypothetical protein